MDDHTVQFAFETFAIRLAVDTDRIDTDIDIGTHALAAVFLEIVVRVVKSDDVCLVVMAQELQVDGFQIRVGTKNVVEFANCVAARGCNFP